MTDSPIPLSLLRRMADPVLREFMDRLEAQLTRLEYRVTKLEQKVAHLQEAAAMKPVSTPMGSDLTHHCACGENTLSSEKAAIWQSNGNRVHTVRRCGKACDHGHFIHADQCPECTTENRILRG